MASFGKNAIVCASRELSGEAYGFARAFSGKNCFGADAIRWLDKNLFGRGLEAGAVSLYFLPLGEPTCPTPDNVRFVFWKKRVSRRFISRNGQTLCAKKGKVLTFLPSPRSAAD